MLQQTTLVALLSLVLSVVATSRFTRQSLPDRVTLKETPVLSNRFEQPTGNDSGTSEERSSSGAASSHRPYFSPASTNVFRSSSNLFLPHWYNTPIELERASKGHEQNVDFD